MGPDWKAFVEELIRYFEDNPYYIDKYGSQYNWQGYQIVKIIKDMETQFLEKSLKIMDLEERT